MVMLLGLSTCSGRISFDSPSIYNWLASISKIREGESHIHKGRTVVLLTTYIPLTNYQSLLPVLLDLPGVDEENLITPWVRISVSELNAMFYGSDGYQDSQSLDFLLLLGQVSQNTLLLCCFSSFGALGYFTFLFLAFRVILWLILVIFKRSGERKKS